jgi:predicted alpha/beta-hydrolase family hydrolase
MPDIPIPRQTLEALLAQTGFDSGRLAIREVNRLASLLEAKTGIKFVRMDFGFPTSRRPRRRPPRSARRSRRERMAHIHPSTASRG